MSPEVPGGAGMVVVPWPAEAARRQVLAAAGSPRLLVLAEGAEPPPLLDCLEDWVHAPVDEGEMQARLEALRIRVRCHRLDLPVLDEEGFLHFRGGRVYLPPVEARLARALLDRYGRVVGATTLMRAGWPGGTASRGKLDVRIHRLRRRLCPVGLVVTTVRQRGWILSESDPATSGATTGTAAPDTSSGRSAPSTGPPGGPLLSS